MEYPVNTGYPPLVQYTGVKNLQKKGKGKVTGIENQAVQTETLSMLYPPCGSGLNKATSSVGLKSFHLVSQI